MVIELLHRLGAQRYHASLAAARPELRRLTVNDLRQLLFKTPAKEFAFDFDLVYPVRQNKYSPDIEFFTWDKLADIADRPAAEVESLYLEKFTSFIVKLHQTVIDKKRTKIPGFWVGGQGRLNFIACFKHFLKKEYDLKMDELEHKIDPRLFGNEIKLPALLESYHLNGGFRLLFADLQELMMAAYPWAFDQDRPEGEYLPLDQFSPIVFGKNDRRNRLALRHKLEKHLGLKMNPHGRKIDPRLLRENCEEFLRSQGYSNWRDLLAAYGLFSPIHNKFVDSVGQFLKWVYPWAFDWSKPEGEHLHEHDYSKKSRFRTVEELRLAFFHELSAAGWTIKDIPKKVTKAWLAEHNLTDTDSQRNMVDYFLKIIPEEFQKIELVRGDFRSGRLRPNTTESWRRTKLKNREKDSGRCFINLENVRYSLPAAFNGFLVRRESADHFVIYDPVSVDRFGELGKLPRPVKVIAVYKEKFPQGKTAYHTPELIDFDPLLHPIMTGDLKMKLLNSGILPHSLSLRQQQVLISEVLNSRENSFGLIIRRLGLDYPKTKIK